VAIGRADHAYWTDLSHVADAPNEHVRDQFLGAHKNLGAYADRLLLLDDGDQVVSGIRAIATPGHSPGHMVYEITSDGETMICWGDLCHHHVLLLEHPDWSFRFDFDGPAATRQRRRIYDLVDSGRYRVFGYHFPFPGVGNVRRDPSGFTWLPADLPRRRPD
jgi:glyoxylase-like metal-dependent hydrolase (beta-lactamase superfamily II)